MTRRAAIFCLEGDWSARLTDRSTVRPILELLAWREKVEFIYRDVGTLADLEAYLRKWGQRGYSRFSVGYLAFHGAPGIIWIGRREVTLERLGSILAGRCRGKVLYFGACATIKVAPRQIEDFRRITKARCICGFANDVGWVPSAAFELVLLDALTVYRHLDAVERYLKRECPGLVKKFDFHMFY